MEGSVPPRIVEIQTTIMPSLRPKLHHTPPPWVQSGVTFFVTICAAHRGNQLLANRAVADGLMSSIQTYQGARCWCRLWLLMPDHVHGLLSLPSHESLAQVVGDWKRFTARRHRLEWQANFFDHRIRSVAELEEKIRYVRLNPVRGGLIENEADWPWLWSP